MTKRTAFVGVPVASTFLSGIHLSWNFVYRCQVDLSNLKFEMNARLLYIYFLYVYKSLAIILFTLFELIQHQCVDVLLLDFLNSVPIMVQSHPDV